MGIDVQAFIQNCELRAYASVTSYFKINCFGELNKKMDVSCVVNKQIKTSEFGNIIQVDKIL